MTMTRRSALAALGGALRAPAAPGEILQPEPFRHYYDEFNARVAADVESHIPDAEAQGWLWAQYPRFACADAEVERTWHYRAWSFRKHLRRTPAGYVFTEFLRPVKHATDHNAISCALGHHIAEGRWLRDPAYLDGYLRFWLTSGEGGGLQRHYHQFSNWTAWACYQRWLADQRTGALVELFPALRRDYEAWDKERMTETGLYWQRDVSDGMEESISGGRRVRHLRPTINSYMYGNARAMAAVARMAGDHAAGSEFEGKAARLRRLVMERLWNPASGFFETVREDGSFAGVRELAGYTPWLFGLPPGSGPHDAAWAQLDDPRGFHAPFGPTTAEQRHPGFVIAEAGDDCQWNGPSWPFATTVALAALANVPGVRLETWFRTFLIYARSQRLRLEDGRVVAFVDENLNPFTGEWHARARKLKKGTYYGRGDHYNHSAFCDLVITGLCGLRPRADATVELRPLLPARVWEWFCLENVPYHGRLLTIVWDRDGERFGRGRGLRVWADGRLLGASPRLGPLRAALPARGIV